MASQTYFDDGGLLALDEDIKEFFDVELEEEGGIVAGDADHSSITFAAMTIPGYFRPKTAGDDHQAAPWSASLAT